MLIGRCTRPKQEESSIITPSKCLATLAHACRLINNSLEWCGNRTKESTWQRPVITCDDSLDDDAEGRFTLEMKDLK